ncbi:E3 SUMO-protein ligase ZBED1-like isoform X11 [Nerophis ophidion]|uniref:E3 SUMO-protein ligase ZBED1-like isoform X11 n=1 Tax=Nerophis ophidion TaxID=159077 RepID=UPI002ADFFFB5|nr:E3 SUMO-protein ligase ZBED1-like isoform X11 [Nerophis ophidion]
MKTNHLSPHSFITVQKQYQDIRELLRSKDQEHRLDGIHQDQLEHLIDFLTLFMSAISELEGEHHPTVQMVLLWFFKLKKHCEPKYGDPPYMKTLRSRASSLLDEKMHPTAAHKIATFLHPKFKSLKMLADEDRREVIKQVRELLLDDGEENPATEPPVTEPQSATEQGGADGTSPKKKRIDFTEWEEDTSLLVDEVEDYSSTNFRLDRSAEEHLLSFWRQQGQSFPRLQHLAKRLLCIPATIAASERSFSAAGRILEARRSRLNPGTVDAILFLHSANKKKSK